MSKVYPEDFTCFLGVDVSKDHLDTKFLPGGRNQATQQIGSKIENTHESIEGWSTGLKEKYGDEVLVILEHTGPYSSKALHYLSLSGVAVMAVNPRQSKAFMESRGETNKNDRQSAHSLALMGKKAEAIAVYQAPPQDMQERKQLISALSALKKQERMLKNQLHALEHQAIVAAKAKAALEAALAAVEGQAAVLEAELNSSRDSSDAEFVEASEYAQSVCGIGPKSSDAILLATNNLRGFDSPCRLAKFLGLTPSSQRSGTSVNKRGAMTKFGSGYARKVLYMAARSAKRYNKACKALYDRLRKRGKCHKVAMVAVMHKLVRQVYVCVKNKTLFNNDHLNPSIS